MCIRDSSYHGVTPFDVKTGVRKKNKIDNKLTYTEIFSRWINEMAKMNDEIVAITPAMREGSGLVEFEKNFGPKLGELDLEKIKNIDEINFTEKIYKVYKAISKTSKDPLMNDKDMIGFIGAPWTILVYMINKVSPKKGLSSEFFKDDFLINRLLVIIEKFLKLHIKNQIEAGADVIQIFDSWAGALNADMVRRYSLDPIKIIVSRVKRQFPEIPFIVFPRSVNTIYSEFSLIKEFDVLAIDQFLDRKWISENIQPKKVIQGNLDPLFLTQDTDALLIELKKVTEDFKNYPYVFNLGHGITPDAKVENVTLVVNYIKELKL